MAMNKVQEVLILDAGLRVLLILGTSGKLASYTIPDGIKKLPLEDARELASKYWLTQAFEEMIGSQLQ